MQRLGALFSTSSIPQRLWWCRVYLKFSWWALKYGTTPGAIHKHDHQTRQPGETRQPSDRYTNTAPGSVMVPYLYKYDTFFWWSIILDHQNSTTCILGLQNLRFSNNFILEHESSTTHHYFTISKIWGSKTISFRTWKFQNMCFSIIKIWGSKTISYLCHSEQFWKWWVVWKKCKILPLFRTCALYLI